MTKTWNVLLTFVRGQRHYTKAWLPDAVRYEKVKYHPRFKDHVDPSITPSKVLMVHRVKPFKGNPYWEKDILKALGFEEKEKKPVFVKNTPDMCAMLWRVKHLVNIVPMKLPSTMPEFNENTEYYIHENGTIHVNGKIDPFRYQAAMDAKLSVKRMNYGTITEKLRLQWLKGNLI